jgi:hypothetical protein
VSRPSESRLAVISRCCGWRDGIRHRAAACVRAGECACNNRRERRPRA